MSIFSKIKSTKKAADEHKAAEAAKVAKQAAEESKPAAPYRHTPKHAAQDALSGTPGVADREAIRQANQARAMYSNDSYYSTSSPSLMRSYSSDAMLNRHAANVVIDPAASSSSISRCSSRTGHRSDRRAHPGYNSYQRFELPSPPPPHSPQLSRRGSSARNSQPRSPLSSEPITPLDSSAASSSSSFSSTRSYNDPIEKSAPFSQRLEAAPAKAAPRTPLYVSQTASAPKPWELAAQKKAAGKKSESVTEVTEISEVPEVQSPARTAQAVTRGRFMGFKGKQQAVAAC